MSKEEEIAKAREGIEALKKKYNEASDDEKKRMREAAGRAGERDGKIARDLRERRN